MKFERKELDGGLKVLFEKRDVGVTTVMLGVKYGSGDDSVEDKGMAHFIEHLCFKGTKKRTASRIVSELESFGGELNAGTHEDFTVYYVKFPSEHLEKAMDVIFDIFFNATFPEDEVERERSVIIEEIRMYHDSPRAHALDKIRENLYEEPFGIFGTGSEENVSRFSRDELKKRYDDVYVAKNAVLAVVGNNDFDEVVRLAERFVVEKKSDFEVKREKIVARSLKGNEKRKDLHQANLVMGFHFPNALSEKRYAAEIFSSILGDGMSSRLHEEVREKRGLVYGIKSDVDMGPDHGYMIVWAGTSPDKVEEVKKVSLEEIGKMKDLSEKELEEAKVRVKGKWKVSSEDCGEVALELISEEVSGRAEEYYDFEKRIDAVRLEDVRELASFEDYAWFSLGP